MGTGGRISAYLGPFELHEIVGRGGMAEVYRATHLVDGATVAVKLLTAAAAKRTSLRIAFDNEVRAVAALDHPHIVQVYEHGTVDAMAARHGGGALIEGTPFLVMEFVPSSLLHRPPRTWSELSVALLAILDGLAHAHARGVIHRDLKAGNVLRGQAFGDYRLSDFGIAHAIDSDGPAFSGGTPGFMAPEQLEGDVRRQGPWTDLYGLGTLAFAMLSGKLPYPEKRAPEAIQARLERPLPALVPRYTVPQDLEAWLTRMLAPQPERRFQSAADAAWALLGLGGSHLAGEQAIPIAFEEAPTELMAPRMTLSWDDESTAEWLPSGEWVFDQPPPMPRDWRRPEVQRERLTGAGLGLTELRPVPMVGRIEERDRLWQRVAAVHARQQCDALLLRGPSGVGKSRLAKWLIQRVRELGIGHTVVVHHSPDGGARDGLGPAIARMHRVDGLDRAEAIPRVRWNLSRLGVSSALAQDVFALTGGAFASNQERQAVFRRLLTELGRDRPVIVWLDDVPWATEALEIVQEFLVNRLPAPVLFLLTAADEQLVGQPIEAAAVQQMVDSGLMTEMAIAPLLDDDQRTLVQQHLGLDPELANRVVERTDGNPLFAVQLISGWVKRGWLEPSLTGFRLARSADEDLPSDVTAAWSNRLDALITDLKATDLHSLEVVAALGQEVDLNEWEEACARLGVPASRAILERLLGHALATRLPGATPSIALVHGMLREAIRTRSIRARRWRGIQTACAQTLQARGADPARTARHLFRSGQFDEAAAAFLEAMHARMLTAEFRVLLAIGREWQRSLESAGAEASDERWGEGWLVQTRPSVYTGDLEAAERLCSRIEDEGSRSGWGRAWARGPAERAYMRLRQGSFEDAITLNQVSADRCRAKKDLRGELAALNGLAWCWTFMGRTSDAEMLLHEVLDRSGDGGYTSGLPENWRLLGVCARQRGDWAESARCYQAALDAAEALDMRSRVGEAECIGGIGDAMRWLGELDAARKQYQRARSVLSEIGLGTELSTLNEAIVDLEEGKYARAELAIRPILETWGTPDAGAHAGIPLLAILPCHAHAGRWDAWEDDRRRALDRLADGDLIDRDVAWLAELAARTAEEAGRSSDARALWLLAKMQWEGCGDRARVDALPV